MNRRQAIKAGITATAAILTITGCKSGKEPEYEVTTSKRTWPEVATWSKVDNPSGWHVIKMRYWDEQGKQITKTAQELNKAV